MSVLLVGAKRSGLFMFAAMVNCSKNYNISFGTIDEPVPKLDRNLHAISIDYAAHKKYGLCLLDKLHQIRQSMFVEKVIWLTRNPVVSSSSFVIKDRIQIDSALNYWVDINTILWYFFQAWEPHTSYMLKYEDILFQNRILKESFRFLGIEFNKQYVRYGDFDHPSLPGEAIRQGVLNLEFLDAYNQSEVNGLSSAWNKWRKKSIVSELGYNLSIDL